MLFINIGWESGDLEVKAAKEDGTAFARERAQAELDRAATALGDLAVDGEPIIKEEDGVLVLECRVEPGMDLDHIHELVDGGEEQPRRYAYPGQYILPSEALVLQAS